MSTERLNGFHLRRFPGIALAFASANLAAAPLTWFPGTPLNEPRSSAATVAVPAGNILLFGGTPIGSIDVLVYEANNAQSITSPRLAPGAVALNGSQFFVFGGKRTNATSSVTSGVLSYNPVSSGTDDPNVFSVASMGTARYDLAYARDAAGYAYAIGGRGNNNTILASIERYDSVSNRWTNMASLPAARYHFGAIFDGTNTIYTFGGRTNVTAGAETAAVLSYSVSGNAWSTLAPMPVATAGSAAAQGADGRFYIIGGTAGGVVTNLVQVYDPGSSTWQIATPLPVAVTSAGAAVDSSGRLVVMGGVDGNGVDQSASWVSQQLNLPDAAPVFTSTVSNRANCLVAYSYMAQANGNPQPTYALITAPDGMTIDVYTGLVTWTPQTNQFGTNLVAILASNFAGTATQTFAINTVGPPLDTPANLVTSDLTDTSVTLSWDPVAYVIGPLTYQVYERTFLHNPKGSGGTYHYHAVASASVNSATIGGLTPGSGHTYVVTAQAAGVITPYSAAIGVAIPAPQAPTNFRATGFTSTTTSLAWDPSTGPVSIAYYSVFESTQSYTLAAVPGATGLTATSVTIIGLSPGSQHTYVIIAYDAAGNASLIGYQQVSVYNPVPTPATLSNFTPTEGGAIQFTVQTTFAQTTFIQASTDPADPNSWITIATNLPAATFTFTDPDAGQFPMRFYRVVSP